MKTKLLFIASACFILAISNLSAQNWTNGGNSLTANGKLGTKSNYSLIFITNNTERGRITNGGNWGIGSTGTSSRFTVNVPSGVSPFRSQINSSTKFIVNSNGGVSIGTSTAGPSNGLYVAGIAGIRGAANKAYALNVNAGSSFGGINITDPVNNSVLYAKKSGILSGILIEKTASGTGTACITGNSTGSSPGLGGFSTNGEGVKAISTNNSGVYGESTIGYGMYAVSKSSGGILATSTDYYGGTFSSINSFGLYAGTTNGFYAGYFNGAVYSTGGYYPCDRNLKKNIEDVTNAMDIVKQLKPKHYDYKNDGKYASMKLPAGNHYGLIAQELESVLPNLVKETTQEIIVAKEPVIKKSFEGNELVSTVEPQKDGKESVTIKAINYTELIPIVIKAVQELDADKDKKIDDLQKQVNELKVMVENLSKHPTYNPSITSGTRLSQNAPNPFNKSTVIRYLIPASVYNAQIMISDAKGRLLKTYTGLKGEGQLNLTSADLPAGTYNYSLLVNSNTVETKQMIITR